MTDLLPALKCEGSCEGGSLVPRIYSGIHLSFAGQSGWPETPHMMHLPSGYAPRIHVLRGNHSSRLQFSIKTGKAYELFLSSPL